MDEQPVKRGRGRPKGTTNKPGHKAGRPVGSGRPTVEIIDSRNNKSMIVKEPEVIRGSAETGNSSVPNLISSCLAIRETVDLENPSTLFSALEQYLTLCAMSGMKISNAMLYFSCGVQKNAIYDWYHGNQRKGSPEYKRFASLVKEICSAAREQYGIEGQTNPILTIFHQKFYDGFRDDPQIDEAHDPLGESQDPQKLAEKYKDIIVD